MKIKSIKFKVTTSNFKCHKCKSQVKGEEGFIHIVGENDSGMDWGGFHNMRICWNCFTELIAQFKQERKGRKKRYNELFKKAIFRRL